MVEERKEYTFYTYLRYFWQKKLYFLIVPLITTLIVVAGVYFLTKDDPYQGTVQFYTGSLDSQELEHPNNVAAKFDEELGKDLKKVFVSEKGQVKFQIVGDSEKQVQAYANQIGSEYQAALEKAADVRIDVTQKYLTAVEKRVEVLKASIEKYKNELNDDTYTPFEVAGQLTNLLMITEQELSAQELSAHKSRSDIAIFEQPQLLSKSVTKEKTYLKESVAIGIILGLMFTVVLLMLMKYIADARRYYKHD